MERLFIITFFLGILNAYEIMNWKSESGIQMANLLLFTNQKPAILRGNKGRFLQGEEINLQLVLPSDSYSIKAVYFDLGKSSYHKILSVQKINDALYELKFKELRKGFYILTIQSEGITFKRTIHTIFAIANNSNELDEFIIDTLKKTQYLIQNLLSKIF